MIPETSRGLRGGPVPSRRTLATGILPSACSRETKLRHPGYARFPYVGSIGTGPPLANPYSGARGDNRSPPARAGADGGPLGHPASDSRRPLTTPTPNPRSPPTPASGRARAISPDARSGHRGLRSLGEPSLSPSGLRSASQRRLDWGGVHLAQARGGPVPSRRTRATGILPCARSWETSLRSEPVPFFNPLGGRSWGRSWQAPPGAP